MFLYGIDNRKRDKRMKKWLQMFLFVTIFISAIVVAPMTIFADDSDTLAVTPQEGDFSFSGTTLLGISSTYLDTLTESQKQNIKIVIPEKTTRIENQAFYNKTGCRFIYLDISKAKLVSIGDHAFNGCTSMQGTLTFQEGITTIGSNAFNNCSSLTGDLVLPDSITSLSSSAFANCTSMNGKLVLSKGLTKIPTQAFQRCGFTGTLTIPNSITSIGSKAFESNQSTGFSGNLVLPDSIISIDNSAFLNQKNITGLTFSKNIQTLGNNVFSGTALTGALTIPDSMTSIGNNVFAYTTIQTLYLPNKSDFLSANGFRYMDSLNAIVCSQEQFATVKGKLSYKADKVGYEIALAFDDTKGGTYPTLTKLFNRPYNYEKDENGIWKANSAFTFPTIENKGNDKWALTSDAKVSVKTTDLVSQDTLYFTSAILEQPVITYSEGIDKVYDGKSAALEVTASHPLKGDPKHAKVGDVVFYYWWKWNTIGNSEYVLKGYDQNVFNVTDVYQPDYAISCRVIVQAYQVLEGGKVSKFSETSHDFTVNLRQQESVVSPQYPTEPLLVANGLPEITTSQGDTKGTISFDAGQTLQEGRHTYTWTFTPVANEVGSSNYTTVTGSVELYGVDHYSYLVSALPTTHGEIVIDKNVVEQGQSTKISFVPEAGYQLKQVYVGDLDVTNKIKDMTYTLQNIQDNQVIRAVFEKLPIEKVEETLTNIPDIKTETVTEKQRTAVLDTLKYYQELEEKTQEEISEETKTKIYETVLKLPQVKVVITGETLEVAQSANLMKNISLEDIKILEEDASNRLEVNVLVSNKTPSAIENQAIAKELKQANLCATLDVSIEKSIINNGMTSKTILSNLEEGIALVFDVPDTLPVLAKGYQRELFIIRVHDDHGVLKITRLNDEDNEDSKITIHSDMFSTYAVAYQDTKIDAGDNENQETPKEVFSITASAGQHGNISPNGTVSVNKGENTTFTISCDEGYEMETMVVDGQAIPAVSQYTFTNVTKNHTITVTFKEKEKTDTTGNEFTNIGGNANNGSAKDKTNITDNKTNVTNENTTKDTHNNISTGDDSQITVWIALMAGTICLLAGYCYYQHKKKNQ